MNTPTAPQPVSQKDPFLYKERAENARKRAAASTTDEERKRHTSDAETLQWHADNFAASIAMNTEHTPAEKHNGHRWSFQADGIGTCALCNSMLLDIFGSSPCTASDAEREEFDARYSLPMDSSERATRHLCGDDTDLPAHPDSVTGSNLDLSDAHQAHAAAQAEEEGWLYYYRPCKFDNGQTLKCSGHGAQDPSHKAFYVPHYLAGGEGCEARHLLPGCLILRGYHGDRIGQEYAKANAIETHLPA